MLMGAHDGTVDHRIFVVRIKGQVLKDPLPYAGLGPTAETSMDILPVSKPFGQVSPRCTGPIAIDHRFHKQSVVLRRHAHRFLSTGKEILDSFPLIIA